VLLRPVGNGDLDRFFVQQLDPEANEMAAFTAKNPSDRGVFNYHWSLMLRDPETVVRTIEVDGDVAGSIVLYPNEGVPELSFWTDRKYWGQGVTTAAVDEILKEFPARPVRARVVSDNIGTPKILERRGFVKIGETKDFAVARAAVVSEDILELA
jgi:RimJ/RimL family protein N-acetyltransferase